MIKRRGWNEGSAAIETAFAFSALMVLVFGIIEFGIALFNQNTMQLVLQEAGRYAMVEHAGDTAANCTADSADVQTYANTVVLANYPIIGTVPASPVSVTSCSGSPVLLTITGTYRTLNIFVAIPSFSTGITVPLS